MSGSGFSVKLIASAAGSGVRAEKRMLPFCGKSLVDKVAQVGQAILAQFHTEQARTDWNAEAFFKTFEDVAGQIGLLPQQSKKSRAVGRVIVVSGQAAGWADRQGERDRSRFGCGAIGGPGAEVDSHTGILTAVRPTLNDPEG